jgi:glycosyltransferase involved in cell wall biosynthesis
MHNMKKTQIVRNRDRNMPISNVNADNFDGEFYIKAYKDLKIPLSGAFVHYCKYGIKENRLPNYGDFSTKYPDFDVATYRHNNIDLGHFDNEKLYSHFHHHGFHENRIYKKQNILDDANKKDPPQIVRENVIDVDNKDNRLSPALCTGTVCDVKTIDLAKKTLIKSGNIKRYYDYDNINKIAKNLQINHCDIDLDTNLNDLILTKDYDKPIYLVLSEWGYPPFGGGECWLIDTMKWMSEYGYACYYVYFTDHTKQSGGNFTEIKVIPPSQTGQSGYFIQFTDNIVKLLKFIKLLDPKIISHQGLNRIKYMKIANLLEKPFVTGFCFWQDIIKEQVPPRSLVNLDQNSHKIRLREFSQSIPDIYNRDMLNRDLIPDQNFQVVMKNATSAYVCGQFVERIVKKVHDVLLPVINTISDEKHYKICETFDLDTSGEKYVTIINVCGLKGGFLVREILKNVSDIPFMLIDSQDNMTELSNELEKIIGDRNKRFATKSLYIRGFNNDIIEIYRKTKLLLIPSLVDETFCRVAYEGMMNRIPIISTKNGNLPFLLNNYADFLDENPAIWANHIKNLCGIGIETDGDIQLKNMSMRPIPIDPMTDKKKFVNMIYKSLIGCNYDYYDSNNIGLFCPWADQGLGVQCREYYNVFKHLGYNVNVFSFKPYGSTEDNPKLQSDEKEWTYPNVHYYDRVREETCTHDFLDFLWKTRVKKLIIVETCYNRVFELANLCHLLGIQVYSIPNLETIRYPEIHKHYIFDKILCNNMMTYDLLSKFIPNKTYHLGFRMLCYLSSKQQDAFPTFIGSNKPIDKKTFFCCGGLNSITRKNIDKIVESFNQLEKEKLLGEFELHVYIQGREIPPNINKYATEKIRIFIGSKSYREIRELYDNNDIFIHLGDHEGLGLGFYESIVCGTPVLTIDTPPNNEIIKENVNGWLIKCDYLKLNDNSEGIVKMANLNIHHIKTKIVEVIQKYDREKIMLSTLNDYITRFPIKEYTDNIRKLFA